MSFLITRKQSVVGLLLLLSCPFLSAMEVKCIRTEEISTCSIERQLEDKFQEQEKLEQLFKEQQDHFDTELIDLNTTVEYKNLLLQQKIDSSHIYESEKRKLTKKIDKLHAMILAGWGNV